MEIGTIIGDKANKGFTGTTTEKKGSSCAV
jgi:hypothetical protein